MTRVLTVRTTDFIAADYVHEGSLRFGPFDVGSRVSQLGFETRPGATLSFVPDFYDYVSLTDTDGSTVRWRGRVRQVARKRDVGVAAGDKFWLAVDCQDWGAELDLIYVADDWEWTAGASDAYMVKQLVDQYWAALGTGLSHTLQPSRPNMPALSITQGSMTLRVAFDTIARLANNARWWIDASKQLHWNDGLTFAPFIMDDNAEYGDTGLYRAYHYLEDFRDLTGVATRITVVGNAPGIEATETNWPIAAKMNRRLSDEAGSPTYRVHQLADVTDTSLTTVAQCTQRALQEIARYAGRRVLVLRTYESGLWPGQKVDVIDRVSGTRTVPYGTHSVNWGTCPSESKKLYLGLGRFFVWRVTPRNRTADKWEYEVEMGDREPTFAQALAGFAA